MEALNVRIVRLDPMRVASAYGFGPSPEDIVWQTLLDWGKAGGLLDVTPAPRSSDSITPTRRPAARTTATSNG